MKKLIAIIMVLVFLSTCFMSVSLNADTSDPSIGNTVNIEDLLAESTGWFESKPGCLNTDSITLDGDAAVGAWASKTDYDLPADKYLGFTLPANFATTDASGFLAVSLRMTNPEIAFWSELNQYSIYFLNWANGILIRKFEGGALTVNQMIPFTYVIGQEYNIKVGAIDQPDGSVKLSVIIDGVEIASYIDSTTPFIANNKIQFFTTNENLTIKPAVAPGDTVNIENLLAESTGWFESQTDCVQSDSIVLNGGGAGAWVSKTDYDLPSDKYLGFNLPATFSTTDGSGFLAVSLRMTNPEIACWSELNQYSIYFLNWANGILIRKFEGGALNVNQMIPFAYVPGQEYSIKVGAIDQPDGSVKLSVIIDGVEVASYIDSTTPFIANKKIQFFTTNENLTIKPFSEVIDPTPTTVPTTDISPIPTEIPVEGNMPENIETVDLSTLLADPTSWYSNVEDIVTAANIEMDAGATGMWATKTGFELLGNQMLKFKMKANFSKSDGSGFITVSLRMDNSQGGYWFEKNQYTIYLLNYAGGGVLIRKYDGDALPINVAAPFTYEPNREYVVELGAIDLDNGDVKIIVKIDGVEIASATDKENVFTTNKHMQFMVVNDYAMLSGTLAPLPTVEPTNEATAAPTAAVTEIPEDNENPATGDSGAGSVIFAAIAVLAAVSINALKSSRSN
ncbi:MAG: hypothetical protein ACYCYM_02050 [Saccharofermentanales bacterium]